MSLFSTWNAIHVHLKKGQYIVWAIAMLVPMWKVILTSYHKHCYLNILYRQSCIYLYTYRFHICRISWRTHYHGPTVAGSAHILVFPMTRYVPSTSTFDPPTSVMTTFHHRLVRESSSKDLYVEPCFRFYASTIILFLQNTFARQYVRKLPSLSRA